MGTHKVVLQQGVLVAKYLASELLHRIVWNSILLVSGDKSVGLEPLNNSGYKALLTPYLVT